MKPCLKFIMWLLDNEIRVIFLLSISKLKWSHPELVEAVSTVQLHEIFPLILVLNQLREMPVHPSYWLLRMKLFGLYLLTNQTVFYGNIPQACELNFHAWCQKSQEGKFSLNGFVTFCNKSHIAKWVCFFLQCM